MKTLKDFDFSGKKALIRVDFNVPLDENLNVTDDTRIQAAKPTIDAILKQGGSVVLMSHLGRPKSKGDDKNSLRHVVAKATEILGQPIKFVNDCIGEAVEKAVNELKSEEILLLENLRFYPEEEAGDVDFAKKLSAWGDIYVNDAFGTAHRAHASTTVVAQFFPDQACFGKLMEKELESIAKVLKTPERPVVAILGGSKVSSKIGIIENILDKIDHLIIGGGMSYTFVKAKGGKVGDSICENDKMDLALQILDKAEKLGVKVHLPLDILAADAFAADAKTQIVPVDEIPDGWQGLDIGPKTEIAFSFVIMQCKTILWNGPVGVFEMPKFAKGTIEIGNAIADATAEGAFSLVGGGDSVSAVKQFGFENKVSYVSTGGGAMLEMLEGQTLPGVAAIK
jgi:phosphoglycerate kinase